jgi:rhodanese-related sulfurtransferase
MPAGYEGGCMVMRAGDPIFQMKDLMGKKIGLSKSLNTIKNDWWRIQEHMAIENMLMLYTQIEYVSPKEASDEVASGKAMLLDVREPVEWEQHIKGSVQVPRGLLEFVTDPQSPGHKPELDPTRRVIVYWSGTRDALAAFILKTLGYAHVANLDGGFAAWKEAALRPTSTAPTSRSLSRCETTGTRDWSKA